MAIAHALLFILIGLVVYYVPGRLLVDLLLRDPEPEETFPFSLGLGLVLVNTAVVLVIGVLGLTASWPKITTAAVYTGSIALTVVLALLRWKLVARPWRALVRRPTHTQMGLWALAAFSCVFFLMHYDYDLLKEDGCNPALAGAMSLGYVGEHVIPTADGSTRNIENENLGAVENSDFLSGRDGQRLGPGVLIAPANALFGKFGFRLVYALQGLLLPALGFLLGRILFGRAWAAWMTAVLLTFNPWALESRVFEENFIANAIGSLTLVLLLRKRPAAALAGLALSLYLGNRHIQIVVVPFVFLYLWHHAETSAKATWAFLVSLVAAMLPYIICHVLFMAWHDGGLLEATFERPLVTHSFFGIELQSRGLLNWPFIPEPLRAPFHAYPTLVAFPLGILRRFGYVLVALVPAGMLYLWSEKRRAELALLAIWFIPLVLMVMVQSNWVNQNKMGIPASSATSFVLWIVGGAVLLADRKRSLLRRLLPPAAGLAVLLVLVPALQSVDAAKDQRVWDYPESYMIDEWPKELTAYLDETPEYVAMDRERFAVAPWPAPEISHEWRPRLMGLHWESLVDDLSAPWFGAYRNAMPDFLRELHWGFNVGISPIRAMRAGQPHPNLEELADTSPVAVDGHDTETVTAWLDMSDSPLLMDEPLTVGSNESTSSLLLDTPGLVEVVTGFDAPWTLDEGTTLLVARNRTGVVYIAVAPGLPNRKARPSWLKVRYRDAKDYPGLRVPIRLPRDGVVRIVELRCYRPTRWYTRFVQILNGVLRSTQTIPTSPS